MSLWLPARLPELSLRAKLLVLISGVTCLILSGQTLFWLSSEVTSIDRRIVAQGVIQAQGVATGTADRLAAIDAARLEQMLLRVAKVIDVVSLEAYDANGILLARAGSGKGAPLKITPLGVFERPRPSPGLAGLLGGKVVYAVQAPIVRDAMVIGHIALTYRSSEIADKSARLIAVALTMAGLWLLVGAGLGTFYVRRITKPLAVLTDAALQIADGKLQAVDLGQAKGGDEIALLHRAFSKLVTDLRSQMQQNAQLLDVQRQLNARLRERVDDMSDDLRARVAHLHAVIGCLQEGVITCDLEGDVLEYNPAATRHLVGLTRLAVGMSIAEISGAASELAPAVREVLAGGRPRQWEWTVASQTGPWGSETAVDRNSVAGERTIAFSVAPIAHGIAAPVGAVVTLRDMTVARLAEARLRRHDRLISLGTIAAGLAHELGNCMHAINGFATLLYRDTPASDPRRSDVATIRDENQRAIDLLERFLQFARPRRVAVRNEPVADLLSEALSLCTYKLRKAKIEVMQHLDEQADTVRCDGPLLVQVLVNLILNAADAMEGLEVRQLRLHSRLVEGDRVAIEVADSGAGIAKEHLERIFDPFFTTKEATGTGLGLSIAHQIVDAHHGTLTVHSSPGAGATFVVTLPRSAAAEGALGETAVLADHEPGHAAIGPAEKSLEVGS